MTPSHTFDQSPKTKQLDYSLVNAWFSLPELNDDADIILKELQKEVQETKEADVFFIHLTTYFSSYSWNQDLNNEDGIYDYINWLSSQVSVYSISVAEYFLHDIDKQHLCLILAKRMDF